MKFVALVCEGLSDEPLQDLSGRTPLEVAKKPNIDALAKKAKVGRASFVPASVGASGDVACLSLLGYNPAESYTGIAPLEVIARGIHLGEEDVAFRCDLVTVLDETLMDNRASVISPKEAKLLVEELNKKLSDKKTKFYPGAGYKNLLVVSDAELAESLDELECASPRSILGKKYTDNLPKGRHATVIIHLMTKSKEILETHEINRVRIDLGENPANMIWPWGQGKKPRLGLFKERTGLNGALVSEASFMKGLGKCAEIAVAKDLNSALSGHDFVLVYKESVSDIYRFQDLKTKIKLIEQFDALVGEAVNALKGQEHRLLITADYVSPLNKVMPLHGHVPFMLCGSGVEADEQFSFNEKIASQSKLVFEDGHKLLEYWTKK